MTLIDSSEDLSIKCIILIRLGTSSIMILWPDPVSNRAVKGLRTLPLNTATHSTVNSAQASPEAEEVVITDDGFDGI